MNSCHVLVGRLANYKFVPGQSSFMSLHVVRKERQERCWSWLQKGRQGKRCTYYQTRQENTKSSDMQDFLLRCHGASQTPRDCSLIISHYNGWSTFLTVISWPDVREKIVVNNKIVLKLLSFLRGPILTLGIFACAVIIAGLKTLSHHSNVRNCTWSVWSF